MKLSQLVRFLNNLDQQKLPDPDVVSRQEMQELYRTIKEGQPYLQNRVNQIEKDIAQVKDSLKGFCEHVKATRQDIAGMIEAMQPTYFADSYRLHQEMIHDSDQYILDRRPNLNDAVQNYLTSRITLHSDWHHAAMVIRPGRGEWLPFMVGCDPLYLVDSRSSLLEHSISQFPPEYQRRLRKYTLKEQDPDNQVLRDLPNAQFGFCLVLNFFQFKPFEIIKFYLAEIYRKLKPGGVVAFTFNDCDRWGGVELAERCFMCYTPGSLMLGLAESLGLEIQQRYDIDNSNTWVEMKKPGTLTSIRGGQSLAKIVANS